MSYEIIRDALCIVVRNQGEYGAFFVRENKAKRNNESNYYQCELTIQSSFGNVGYYWNAMANPAAMFFDRTESDYILGKLWGDKLHLFCGDSTIKQLKRQLFRDIRCGDVHNSREIYNALNEIGVGASDAREMYEDMCFNAEYDDGRKALLEWLPNPAEIEWGTRINPQADGLWRVLWPEFVKALNEEALRPRDIVP